jgi:hypothetical protein
MKKPLIVVCALLTWLAIGTTVAKIRQQILYERAQIQGWADKRERELFLVRLRDRNPQAITNSVQMRWPTQ